MISTTDEQGSVANEPAAPIEDASRATAGEGAGAASLDKVRDILFGGHMRDVERRFARLEERLLKETSDLKDDVKRRLDTLELYTKNETESLAGQIKAEHEDRVEASGRMSRDAADTARSIERRITTLDEQVSKSQRELRSQMLEQHQRLTDDIRHKMEDVLATLARETGELRTDKADRTAIASLLTEMALRLTNQFRLPGAEDGGNG
jgi:DNA anti-recombination protein RmuC